MRHKASDGTRSSTSTTWAVLEYITFRLEVNDSHLKVQVTEESLALQWFLVGRWAEMDHVAPCKPCFHTIVDIKSLSEDALGVADVSTMADTAKPRIGAWREVLNILRFSFRDLTCDDKGVAGTRCNSHHLILSGINPLLTLQVLLKLPLEGWMTTKVVSQYLLPCQR